MSGTNLFAFDDDTSFNGVGVSAAGQNLLEVDFSTPDSANGMFRLFATPGLGDSQWSDDGFNDQEFANLPFSGGAVEVGTVNVVTTIPEPAGLVLCGLAAGLALLVRARSRRRGRN